MPTNQRTIGFDRTLELGWLDVTAAKVAAGASVADVRRFLWDYLEGVVRGNTSNSGRGKTVTVLVHIWSRVPVRVEGLRQRASALLSSVAPGERLALHWAMANATYPFFHDVATTIGKLLALQGEFLVPHITRRLVGRWGQRQLVERCVQHVTRSMVRWRVLHPTRAQALTADARRVNIRGRAAEVLAEAVLMSSGAENLPYAKIRSHPALFPFDVTMPLDSLRNVSHFTFHRDGDALDLVGLAADPNARIVKGSLSVEG